jgi:coenzyme PQQ biosynthesis protein PqqD
MILLPERGLALNRSSAAIVRLLDGEHKVGEIVAKLGAESAGDPARIAADVEAFLAELERRALLEWIP